MKILLIEPTYKSKFPPLGLMRISNFHKSRGDNVSFEIGCKSIKRNETYDRIYISTLFTYELPTTVKTIKYYENSVSNPRNEIIVGGIAATLLPEYLRQNCSCKVITGPLDCKNHLGFDEDPISELIPDYDILRDVEKKYTPENAYFTRITTGCIRKCKFCAVPILEPKFGYLQSVSDQVEKIKKNFGEMKDLVVMDNNILALKNVQDIIKEISNLGFSKGSRLDGKLRYVDFNQGIDARLITSKIAKDLSKLNLFPVRLANDHISVIEPYKKAIQILSDNGLRYFTTYVMFNFNDDPQSFYSRLRLNIDLSIQLNIKITGFPMKFVPINDVKRHHVSENWNWRYLRGIQCILIGTHGMVSPNPSYFENAFGKTYEEFLQIISMPDNFIIYRKKNSLKASEWRNQFNNLSMFEKNELLDFLSNNHSKRSLYRHSNKKINKILQFYKK